MEDHLVGGEAVGTTQAEGETLTVEAALDPAGEDEEKESKEDNQVWIFH